MTLEEARLILGYLGTLGIGGIVGGGIMWFIVKAFIPAYLAEKGKNLATKEDIGAITRKVEEVKTEFALQVKELEHQKTLLTESFKSSLSQHEEFTRTANAAVVELTKKLAAGSFLVSWLSWSATQSEVALTEEDFASYDKDMLSVLSDLIGLQASVAALDSSKSSILSPFADQLYDRDIEMGTARDLFLTKDPTKRERGIEILKRAHKESQDFDEALLDAVTNLLRPAPRSG